MPANELALFEQNLRYAREMAATATALKAHVTSALNVDDLYRAALVQGVSAFDHFIHEEVRALMLEIQVGGRPRAAAFDRFRVTLKSVSAVSSTSVQWLEDEIRQQHGFLSFQQPDKVADAIRLVSDVSLWQAVGGHMGLPAEEVKRDLKLIVDRRNKIAHEADTDPTPPPTRYPITAALVQQSHDTLQKIVHAIVAVI